MCDIHLENFRYELDTKLRRRSPISLTETRALKSASYPFFDESARNLINSLEKG